MSVNIAVIFMTLQTRSDCLLIVFLYCYVTIFLHMCQRYKNFIMTAYFPERPYCERILIPYKIKEIYFKYHQTLPENKWLISITHKPNSLASSTSTSSAVYNLPDFNDSIPFISSVSNSARLIPPISSKLSCI